MQLKQVLIPLGLIAAASGVMLAQGGKPLSPPAETSIKLNGKAITIKYSAPSIRGRKIFGGLVPYGEVWRTGANAATSLHTDAELELGGLKIAPGDYTLYSLPEPGKWTLIVNKQTGQWGTEYNQGQDLGRVPLTVGSVASPVEVFKITLSAAGKSSGKLELEWDKTSGSITFTAK